MADDHKKEEGSPMQLLWMVIAFMAVLITLWFYSGAYKNADLNGIFLAPPAPVGPGDAYGPEFGTTNEVYNQ